MANTAVFGIYASVSGAELAIDDMKQAGFRLEDISVLLPENSGTKDFAFQKGTKAPEGTAAGAASGAVIGGALGWLVGIGALRDSGPWTIHCRRTTDDRVGGSRSGRRFGRADRRAHWYGHSGIPGKAVRGACEERQYSDVCTCR